MSVCDIRRQSHCRGAACGAVQTHHVYALVDIRLPSVFYIGISIQPYRRLQDHVSSVRSRLAHDVPLTCKQRVIASLLDDGLVPVMILLDSIATNCHIEAKRRESDLTAQAIREGLPIVGRDEYISDGRYDYKETYCYDLADHIHRMNELKAMYHE